MDMECSSRAGVAKIWLKLLVSLGGGPLAVWLECAFGEVIFQPSVSLPGHCRVKHQSRGSSPKGKAGYSGSPWLRPEMFI